MRDVIEGCVGENKSFFLNSNSAVEQLIGETMAANLYLAGFAYQQGLIPISAEAIEKAIELNGAAVDENRQAFNLGRLEAFAPEQLNLTPTPLPEREDLEAIRTDRHQYLTQYQNKSYANAFLTRVRQFADATSDELGEVLAINYFKLLAYKDEYEVARLYSSQQFIDDLQEQFEGSYKLSFHLAPPVIAPVDSHTGLPRKITFGGWMLPMFKILARFRFLRGTRLDPFGYTRDRKLERALIRQYESDIDQCEQEFTTDNQEVIRQLLQIPQKIRGYGHIKQKSADLAVNERQRLLNQLMERPEPIKVIDPKAA
jgi:indolepyruvate ferredoxin oxidoreductase